MASRCSMSSAMSWGVLSACRALLNQYDAKQLAETDPARRAALRQEANEAPGR